MARLLQIPVAYEGESINGRAWLILTSVSGILVATYALWTLFTAGNDAASTLRTIQP